MTIPASHILEVAIVGAAERSLPLIKQLLNGDGVNVIGVSDDDPNAPGLAVAKASGARTDMNIEDLVNQRGVQVVINAPGSSHSTESLSQLVTNGVEIVDGASTRLLCALAQDRNRVLNQEPLQKLTCRYMQILEESIGHLDAKYLELSLLNDIASAFSSAEFALEHVAEFMFGLMVRTMDVDMLALLIDEGSDRQLELVSQQPIPRSVQDTVQARMLKAYTSDRFAEPAHVDITVNAHVATNVTGGGRSIDEHVFSEDAVYTVPLVVAETPLGLLGVVVSGRDSLTQDDVRFLAIIASQIALFVENERVKKHITTERNQLGSILHSMTNAVIAVDEKQRVLLANDMAASVLGIDTQQVVGRTVAELNVHHGADKLVALLDESRTRSCVEEIEVMDSQSGGTRILKAHFSHVLDDEGAPIGKVLVVHDLTKERSAEVDLRSANSRLRESKRAVMNVLSDLKRSHSELQETQSQLVQSEKLASLGQLAAGVAHEINNPIGFILNNVQMLEEYHDTLRRVLEQYALLSDTLAPTLRGEERAVLEQAQSLVEEADLSAVLDELTQVTAETIDGTLRVKQIVTDLRTFSRVEEAEFQPTDVNAGLESTLNIVWNQLKYKVELVKEYGELPLIQGFPQKLNQVFLNLLVNAGHAIDQKGTITIKTGAGHGEVVIEISDTGSGISPEVLPKIFDPFFTTKPVGEGTGLGMAIVHGIIEQHHGEISVESEVGVGTTFRIRLPVMGREPVSS